MHEPFLGQGYSYQALIYLKIASISFCSSQQLADFFLLGLIQVHYLQSSHNLVRWCRDKDPSGDSLA